MMIFTNNNLKMFKEFKKNMIKEFEMNDIGEMSFFWSKGVAIRKMDFHLSEEVYKADSLEI